MRLKTRGEECKLTVVYSAGLLAVNSNVWEDSM